MRILLLLPLVMGSSIRNRKSQDLEVDIAESLKTKDNKQVSETPCTGQKYDGCHSYPCLIFNEEFNTLDMSTWEHEITAGGGGNWEFQYYTNNRSNSYVRDGILYMKPTLTSEKYGKHFLQTGKLELWGSGPYDKCTSNKNYGCERQGSKGFIINPIQSAKIRSSRGFSMKYGKIEIEAKLPKGDWIWPTISMSPTYDAYGAWPTSGEVDIVESRGNLDYRDSSGVSQGVNWMGCSLHFGPDYHFDQWKVAHAEKILDNDTFGDSYHKFGLEWTEDYITFLVDDVEILHVDPGADGFWKFGGFDQMNYSNPWIGQPKMAPFDQEFHIVLNVAVGGHAFFPDGFTNAAYPRPWQGSDAGEFWQNRTLWYPTWNPHKSNGEDAAMKVKYVKVWKLKP